MGRAVIDAAAGNPAVTISAAIDRPDAPGLGAQVAQGVIASADLAGGLDACDVYVDFTSPAATRAAAERRRGQAPRRRDRHAPALVADDEAAVAEARAGRADRRRRELLARRQPAARPGDGRPRARSAPTGTPRSSRRITAPSATRRRGPRSMIARAIAAGHGSTTTRSSATRATATSAPGRAARSAWPRCAAAT